MKSYRIALVITAFLATVSLFCARSAALSGEWYQSYSEAEQNYMNLASLSHNPDTGASKIKSELEKCAGNLNTAQILKPEYKAHLPAGAAFMDYHPRAMFALCVHYTRIAVLKTSSSDQGLDFFEKTFDYAFGFYAPLVQKTRNQYIDEQDKQNENHKNEDGEDKDENDEIKKDKKIENDNRKRTEEVIHNRYEYLLVEIAKNRMDRLEEHLNEKYKGNRTECKKAIQNEIREEWNRAMLLLETAALIDFLSRTGSGEEEWAWLRPHVDAIAGDIRGASDIITDTRGSDNSTGSSHKSTARNEKHLHIGDLLSMESRAALINFHTTRIAPAVDYTGAPYRDCDASLSLTKVFDAFEIEMQSKLLDTFSLETCVSPKKHTEDDATDKDDDEQIEYKTYAYIRGTSIPETHESSKISYMAENTFAIPLHEDIHYTFQNTFSDGPCKHSGNGRCNFNFETLRDSMTYETFLISFKYKKTADGSGENTTSGGTSESADVYSPAFPFISIARLEQNGPAPESHVFPGNLAFDLSKINFVTERPNVATVIEFENNDISDIADGIPLFKPSNFDDYSDIEFKISGDKRFKDKTNESIKRVRLGLDILYRTLQQNEKNQNSLSYTFLGENSFIAAHKNDSALLFDTFNQASINYTIRRMPTIIRESLTPDKYNNAPGFFNEIDFHFPVNLFTRFYPKKTSIMDFGMKYESRKDKNILNEFPKNEVRLQYRPVIVYSKNSNPDSRILRKTSSSLETQLVFFGDNAVPTSNKYNAIYNTGNDYYQYRHFNEYVDAEQFFNQIIKNNNQDVGKRIQNELNNLKRLTSSLEKVQTIFSISNFKKIEFSESEIKSLHNEQIEAEYIKKPSFIKRYIEENPSYGYAIKADCNEISLYMAHYFKMAEIESYLIHYRIEPENKKNAFHAIIVFRVGCDNETGNCLDDFNTSFKNNISLLSREEISKIFCDVISFNCLKAKELMNDNWFVFDPKTKWDEKNLNFHQILKDIPLDKCGQLGDRYYISTIYEPD